MVLTERSAVRPSPVKSPRIRARGHRNDGHLEGDDESVTEEADDLDIGIRFEHHGAHDEAYAQGQRNPPGDHLTAFAGDGGAIVLPELARSSRFATLLFRSLMPPRGSI